MPTVLQRFDRPPTYDLDPSLINGVNFGFAESHPGGDYVLEKKQEGNYGLLSPHNPTENTDRETINHVAPLIERELDESKFDLNDPEASMRDIFRMAQTEVSNLASSQEDSQSTRFDMTLVKVFVDPADGELKVAYGHTGRHWILSAQPGRSSRSLSKEFDDSLSEQGIGAPPNDNEASEFGVIPFDEAQQLIILSRNATGYNTEEGYSSKEIKKALETADPNEAAQLLIKRNDYENRTALFVRAPLSEHHNDDDEMTGWQRFKSRFTGNRSPDEDEASSKRMNQRRGLGRLSLAGAGAYLGTRATNWRHDRAERRAGNALVEQEDSESRKRSRAGKALLVGALVVGSLIAMRYAVDLGDELAELLDDRPDSGVDPWPFGDGDINDGDGRGWDLNSTNENLNLNDDPVNESFVDTKGFDVAPPFIDGDWFSLTDGDIETPVIDLEPDVELPVVEVPDVDVPVVEVPDVDVPVVVVPEVPVVIVPPPPPVWTPDVFTVENGNGLIKEIHQIGHEVVGFNDFDTTDAAQVYEAVQAQYGDSFLELPNHAGADLYRFGAELRISAPGQAQWASQEIENFVHEKMKELAAA